MWLSAEGSLGSSCLVLPSWCAYALSSRLTQLGVEWLEATGEAKMTIVLLVMAITTVIMDISA